MDNLLKKILFNIVSGRITSDAEWKLGEVFLLRFDCIFLILRALVKYS